MEMGLSLSLLPLFIVSLAVTRTLSLNTLLRPTSVALRETNRSVGEDFVVDISSQKISVGQNSSLTPHSCRSPYFYSFLFFFPLSVESYESAACFSLASFTECSLSAFLQQYFVSLLFGQYLHYVYTHTINNRSCGVEPASSGWNLAIGMQL